MSARESVRLGMTADLEAIVSMYTSWLDESQALRGGWTEMEGLGQEPLRHFSDAIEDPHQCVLIAEYDGAAAGYSVSAIRRSRGGLAFARIAHLFVESDFRGVSLGSILMAANARWARLHGAERLEIDVLPGSREAKNLCEQLGLTARLLTMSAVLTETDAPIWQAEAELAETMSDLPWGTDPGTAAPALTETELCVGVAIVDGGRIVLVRRAFEPAQGKWSLPGGRVRRGEGLEGAAVREALEETGLDVEIGGLLGVAERRDDSPGGRDFLICDFTATVRGGELRAGSDASEADWFPLDALPDEMAPGLASFLGRSLGPDGLVVTPIYDPRIDGGTGAS